ncbi:MAG: hypothetical protein JWR40_2327 [Massilia sp.]|jgi:hypothetical protein|nr:hypothetical protein [Massilia sp.]
MLDSFVKEPMKLLSSVCLMIASSAALANTPGQLAHAKRTRHCVQDRTPHLRRHRIEAFRVVVYLQFR